LQRKCPLLTKIILSGVALLLVLSGCAPISLDRGVAVVEEKQLPRELVFWCVSDGNIQQEFQMQQLVNQYNIRQDDVTVQLQMKSRNYFYREFSMAVASQTNPDIGLQPVSHIMQLADHSFLYAVDQAIGSSSPALPQYYPQTLEQVKLYGQHVGVPIFMDTMVLVARQDVLDRAGIAPPGNMAELLSALRKLSGTTLPKGIAIPSAEGCGAEVLMHLFLINGGSCYDSKGNIQLTTPENIAVIDFCQTLYKENLLYASDMNLSEGDVVSAFAKGGAAFALISPSSLWPSSERYTDEFYHNTTILTNFGGLDGNYYCSGAANCLALCVYKNSELKTEALKFARWLSQQYFYTQDTGNAFSALMQDPAQQPQVLDTIEDQVKYSVFPNAVSPTYPLDNSVHAIILEGLSILDELQNALPASEYTAEELLTQYQAVVDEYAGRFYR